MFDHPATDHEILLTDEDFPDSYRNMAHPDDYQEIDKYHGFGPKGYMTQVHRKTCHNRLLVRAAWLLPNGRELPMTFVVDTGAPQQMYFGSVAMAVLTQV
eukprot:TRINITY_DN24044_c0_g1_i1.p1 TRINITY_DN24044_c0_g1~~TRINITY_DN24044_c0_g1_i1.p1  ORF type:complete len:100 (-),score=7.24 TRINITY_DN24044_c0_g1_i1:271-570(-)